MQISPALNKRYQFLCFAGVALALSLIAILGGMVFTLIGFSNLHSWWDIAVSASTQNLLFSATIQAFWSTILSLILGTLVARALFRRNWVTFSSLLATLSFVAMIMPTTVAALALLAVWGRNGLLRDVLEIFNLEGMLFPAYGLEMVVLAHVFFNAPLVLRVMLGALYAVPETQNRLASQLRFNAFSYWKWIEWPAIKVHIPSLFGLIFLLCFSSFSLVLMLGGGPKVSTLEVAIYTSLRFSFDLPTAGVLACLQLGISTAIILLLSRFKSVHWAVSLHSKNTAPRPDKSAFLSVLSDVLMFALFCFLIGYPLVNLVAQIDFHAGGSLFHRPQFWQALQGSLLLGLLSSIISVSIVCVLSNAYYRIGFFWEGYWRSALAQNDFIVRIHLSCCSLYCVRYSQLYLAAPICRSIFSCLLACVSSKLFAFTTFCLADPWCSFTGSARRNRQAVPDAQSPWLAAFLYHHLACSSA